MNRGIGMVALAIAAGTLACAGDGVEDGTGGPSDAGGSTIPAWQLEDVQPLSPRFGTTYGLSVHAGRPVVVVLLEGF